MSNEFLQIHFYHIIYFVPASPDQGHDRPCRRDVGRVFLAGVRPVSPSRRRIPSCYRPGPGRGVVVVVVVVVSQARSYARSKTQIENEKRRFSMWNFSIRRIKLSYAPGFWRFPSSIFRSSVFVHSIARKWGWFSITEMVIEKYCATRYQGVCETHSQKPI